MFQKAKIAVPFFITAGVLFLLCMLEAITGLFETQELQIFYHFQSLMSGGFGKAVKLFTSFGDWEAVVLILAVLLLVPNRQFRYHIAFPTAAATAVSWLCNESIKALVGRARPAVEAFIVERGNSFPSGHSMNSGTMYFSLFLLVLRYMKKGALKNAVLVLLFIMPILLGLSRIMVGVHYLSDVLGGLAAGAMFAAVLFRITKIHRIPVLEKGENKA